MVGEIVIFRFRGTVIIDVLVVEKPPPPVVVGGERNEQGSQVSAWRSNITVNSERAVGGGFVRITTQGGGVRRREK